MELWSVYPQKASGNSGKVKPCWSINPDTLFPWNWTKCKVWWSFPNQYLNMMWLPMRWSKIDITMLCWLVSVPGLFSVPRSLCLDQCVASRSLFVPWWGALSQLDAWLIDQFFIFLAIRLFLIVFIDGPRMCTSVAWVNSTLKFAGLNWVISKWSRRRLTRS